MTLKIIIHDVGHGQAIHVFTPNGKTMVIDLGCGSDFSPLHWLKDRTSTIDSLVITHPHGDHIDEFLLLKDLGFSVRQINRPKWLTQDDVYKQNQSNFNEKLDAYFDMSERYSYVLSDGENVSLPENNGGVIIKCFYSPDCGVSNINNHSLVIYIEYEGSAVMIPGDNEPASWNKLLEQPDFLEAIKKTDIFMASHHGRESGYSSDLFFEKPSLCVVSDGRVQSTDATSRYSHHAEGWQIHHRNGKASEERFCLTTRSDGAVDIAIGKGSNGRFLAVTVD
jgi:beta-lactamase superfamily II metal-dependent hydrolase